ncbi:MULTISPECIES: NAD-binding protein [unclassified Mycobacterium]|uniref:NAD-binding protein n=1 Tax=unclassified Mycobacterium TaxID=2642494 RepID=UPI0029C76AB2|nr:MULTISPECIES: NAD-binding protein [unclassified Mycobacterium]
MLDALKSPGTDKRLWLTAAVIAVAAFVLGYLGYRRQFAGGNWTDPIYHTLALFVLNYTGPPPSGLDWRVDFARFLAPAATGLVGFTAVYTLFRQQLREMRVRRWKDHVVVCGLGYKGYTFVQRLHDDGFRVVVVEHDGANPTIDDCRELGVPVIVGDAQYDAILRRAGVHGAKWLLSVCNDDAVNTEILLSARTVVADRSHGTLKCLAQISDSQLCGLLRVSQIDQHDGTWAADFFNTDDTSAALILRKYPIATKDDKPPHILVAHLDPLGQQLIVLAAQKWMSQRKHAVQTREMPLVVTVVDDAAAAGVGALEREHAVVRDVCTFVTTSASAGGIAELEDAYARGDHPNPTVAYVAASDDDDGVATTLLLMHHLKPPIKVVAALSRTYGTGKLLDSLPGVAVEVFPRFEMTCTPDLLFEVSVEQLAREIHEVWREEQRAANKKDPTWEEASASYRESSMAQAHDIPAKLRSIDCSARTLPDGARPDFEFTEPEIERLAVEEHNRWWAERRNDGWTWAPGEKDEAAKTSPSMVPFGDLPPDVAEWDRVFVRKIPRILQQAGLQVHRKRRGFAAVEGKARTSAV